MGIYAVGSISGAHLNPAVSIALAASGDFPWAKVPFYIVAQILGAFTGAVIVWLHYLPHWGKTEDQATKLGVFCTIPAIWSPFANLLSEIIGTFILVCGLLFIGANQFSEGLNPLVVGGLIIAIGVSLGATTGYAINPARDLGPRLAHFLLPIKGKGTSDWPYAHIPVAGPVIGGLMGAMFYLAVFKGEFKPLFWIISLIVLIIVVFAVKREQNIM
jgi:glycerol uptake facilitator protein